MNDIRNVLRNRLLTLSGHFAHAVRVDAVEEIGTDVYLLKVRDGSGLPGETQVTGEELELAYLARSLRPFASMHRPTRRPTAGCRECGRAYASTAAVIFSAGQEPALYWWDVIGASGRGGRLWLAE